jgi:hypothetical protein
MTSTLTAETPSTSRWELTTDLDFFLYRVLISVAADRIDLFFS